MKKKKLIENISRMLLEEKEVINKKSNEKNGIRLTNEYSYNVIPIGMLKESEKILLKSYFSGILNDYYYMEKI